MSQATARTPRRRNAQQAPRKADGRDKCTLLLDREMSIKLTIAAHNRGMDRSDFVNELLGNALRHIVISYRGQSTESASQGAEVKLEGAEAA